MPKWYQIGTSSNLICWSYDFVSITNGQYNYCLVQLHCSRGIVTAIFLYMLLIYDTAMFASLPPSSITFGSASIRFLFQLYDESSRVNGLLKLLSLFSLAPCFRWPITINISGKMPGTSCNLGNFILDFIHHQHQLEDIYCWTKACL